MLKIKTYIIIIKIISVDEINLFYVCLNQLESNKQENVFFLFINLNFIKKKRKRAKHFHFLFNL